MEVSDFQRIKRLHVENSEAKFVRKKIAKVNFVDEER